MDTNAEFINIPIEAPLDRNKLLQELERLERYFVNQKYTYSEMIKTGNQISDQKHNFPSFGFRIILAIVSAIIIIVVTGVISLLGSIFQSTSFLVRLCSAIAYYQILLVCVIISAYFYIRGKVTVQKRIDELQKQYEECRMALPAIYNAASNCFVSYEHCDPGTIHTLYEYIVSNRAHTYSEALNCLITDRKLDKIQMGVDDAVSEARMANISVNTK